MKPSVPEATLVPAARAARLLSAPVPRSALARGRALDVPSLAFASYRRRARAARVCDAAAGHGRLVRWLGVATPESGRPRERPPRPRARARARDRARSGVPHPHPPRREDHGGAWSWGILGQLGPALARITARGHKPPPVRPSHSPFSGHGPARLSPSGDGDAGDRGSPRPPAAPCAPPTRRP